MSDTTILDKKEVLGKKIEQKIVQEEDILNPDVKEVHCQNCGRFLLFQAIVEGTIAVKCRRCKEWNALDIRGILE